MSIAVVQVSDRTWEAMRAGASFDCWPGEAPSVGERVVVFDRDLDFTQHDVVAASTTGAVTIGPAIPWAVVM